MDATEKGIACPRCGCRHLETSHTRPAPNGKNRRYRNCRHCNKRIVTVEAIEEKPAKLKVRRD